MVAENHQDGIDAFKSAYKEYPDIQHNGYAVLCFNLGKAYFDSGNIELGVYYLSKYCGLKSEGDQYKAVLDEFFHFKYKSFSVNGITHYKLQGGKLNGKSFKVTKSKVYFDKP